MLEGLFKGMLNISLYASVVAVVIMLIKLIKMMCGRRLSPDFHYGIWSLFLLKLVLPLDIKSVFSIFTLFERVAGEPVTERIDAVLPPIDAGALAQPAGLPPPGLADGLPVASPGPDPCGDAGSAGVFLPQNGPDNQGVDLGAGPPAGRHPVDLPG